MREVSDLGIINDLENDKKAITVQDSKNEGKIPILKSGKVGKLGNLSSKEELTQLTHQLTQLTQLTQNPTYPIKEKIVFTLFESNNSMKKISEILKEELVNISRNIKREDREKGLFYDGLVEVKEKKGNVDIWGLTKQGESEVKFLLNQFEQKRKREEDIAFVKHQVEDQISIVKEYLEGLQKDMVNIKRKGFIFIDFMNFAKHSPEVAEDILENPIDLIKVFQIAFGSIDMEFEKIIPRFINLPKSQYKEVGDLRFDDFNKLLFIDGMIKGRSETKPKVNSSMFECPSCGNRIPLLQTEKMFKEPSRCGCGRKGKFIHLMNEDKLVSVQFLELEEFSENLKGVNEPRTIHLLLQNDLCDSKRQKDFNPGIRVRFVGYYCRDWKLTANTKNNLLDTYFECNSYEVLEQNLEFNVNEFEKKELIDLSERDDLIEVLVDSFCPEIIGNRDEKLALLLSAVKAQIFLPKYERDRIHLLLVSNPGHAKTQMIKQLVDLTPCSRFASATDSSKVGLTGAVVKDEFLGGWKLSAGAVALANNGLCAVDELAELAEEHKKGLNHAMENGEVFINKATIHQRLITNTTIIAACNPKNERFDPDVDSLSQVDLPGSLLDRFDLVFNVGYNFVNRNKFLDFVNNNVDKKEVVSEDLLSKYLLLATNHTVNLSIEIENFIAKKADFLASQMKEFEFRQFKSIFRLSVAFAKLRLRESIIEDDVIAACKLFIKSKESFGLFFSGEV